jgi:hypothetical protein
VSGESGGVLQDQEISTYPCFDVRALDLYDDRPVVFQDGAMHLA